MSPTVTIDKASVEPPIQAQEHHTDNHAGDVDGVDYTTPIDLPLVTIPKVDHDNLLRFAREYLTLRAALHAGGIDQHTVDVLVAGDPTASTEGFNRDTTTFAQTQNNFAAPRVRSGAIAGRSHYGGSSIDWACESQTADCIPALASKAWRLRSSKACFVTDSARTLMGAGDFRDIPCSVDASEFEYDDAGSGSTPSIGRQARLFGNNRDRRSLVLGNLAPSTTHKDLTSVIRGGQILDLYLRQGRDLCANLAFVCGPSAEAFFEHVKRNDLYLNGRRVEVSWNERQFVLQGHIASRIFHTGATRNLCLMNITPQITVEKLQVDLEHIHNLAVVDMWLNGSSLYVHLNSVASAVSAKQCLQSRAEYKGGLKIKYIHDDCADPLPERQRRRLNTSSGNSIAKKVSAVSLNRFQALSLGSESSSQSGASEFTVTTDTEGGVPLINL